MFQNIFHSVIIVAYNTAFMTFMKKKLQRALGFIEDAPTSLGLWLTSFLSLIIARLMVESWLANFKTISLQFLFYEFTHTFSFFLLSFLIIWPILAFFSKTSLRKTSNILLFGFLIILTPPLIDAYISHGQGFWSFYKFDSLAGLWQRYLTFFGDRPDIGITYGVRVEVALTTIFFGIYTFLKTANVLRSLIATLAIYTILFLFGTLPSWIAFVLLGFQKSILSIGEIDIAQLFLTPPTLFTQSGFDIISALNIKLSLIYIPLILLISLLYLWKFNSVYFVSLLKNARIPQLIYHGGLLLLGMGLAILFAQAHIPTGIFTFFALINILIAVGFSWLASVVANDIFDQKIDNITNAYRPLPQHTIPLHEYKVFGILFFSLSLLLSALASFKIMCMLVIYQALAWLYSAPPFRLKRFPLIATFFASLASIIVILAGFSLIAPDQTIAALPLSLILLLCLSYTLSLPLKDLKDIAGDKADNVYTLPVLFGEYWGKIIIGSSMFLSFIISVSVLHESKLFPWAFICGGAAFWIIMSSQANEKKRLSYRRLPGWILLPIIFYALILMKIVL